MYAEPHLFDLSARGGFDPPAGPAQRGRMYWSKLPLWHGPCDDLARCRQILVETGMGRKLQFVCSRRDF
jgi:hypothetical protein